MPLSSYPLGGTLMPKSGVFVVTDELRRVLDSLPADEPRSRLEPFRVFILRWRRDGRSYSRIQQILAAECQVKVSAEAVRKFVHSRSRPRKLKPEVQPEVEQAVVVATVPQPAEQPRKYTKLSPEQAAQQRATLQALRNKPALEPKPAVLEEFHYDPDKPLTIDRSIKD